MISMRYGTVPIVRETGGLKDTVQPYEAGVTPVPASPSPTIPARICSM